MWQSVDNKSEDKKPNADNNINAMIYVYDPEVEVLNEYEENFINYKKHEP